VLSDVPHPSASRTRRFLRRAVMALGWASFALIAAALTLESHPRLERWAVARAQERLAGPLTGTLDVEDIDVLWLQRSIALRGVSMGPSGDDVRAREVVCRLGVDLERGVHVDRVTIRDGAVVVSDVLSAALQGGADAAPEGSVDVLDLITESPEVVVRDLAISLQIDPTRRVAVASVDLSMTGRGDSGSRAEIFGRLVPTFLGSRSGDPGVVWLRGTLGDDRVVRMEGIARALALEIEPETIRGTPIEGVLAYEPSARVDLVANGTLELGASLVPSIDATARLWDGRVTLPWLPRASERPVDGVELALAASYAPGGPGEPLFGPDRWSVEGALDVAWEDLVGAAGFRAGAAAPEGDAFEVWAEFPDAPLDERLGELAAGEEGIREVEAMLRPRGRSDVSLAVRLPRGRADVAKALERLALIQPRGAASLAYHGVFDRIRGERDVGFPLPVRRVDGDVAWSVHPGERYPGQLGFFAARGEHTGGPVAVHGSLHFVPISDFERRELARLVPAPFHLVVESEDLAFDDEFEAAMEGLDRVPEIQELLPTWNPSGGDVDFRLELKRTLERSKTALELDLVMAGVDARWKQLGVPLRDVRGRVSVRTSGEDPSVSRGVTTLALQATTEVSSEPIEVRGRVRGEGPNRSLGWFEVEARSVNARSRALREELGRKDPKILEAFESVGASGFLDVAVTAAADHPMPEARALRDVDPELHAHAGGLVVSARVTPEARTPIGTSRRRVAMQPRQFSVPTRDVRGGLRVLAKMPPDPRVVTREASMAGLDPDALVAPAARVDVGVEARMQALWRQDDASVPLAMAITSRGGTADEPRLHLTAIGAGLDIANDGLMGEVLQAARRISSKEVGRSDPIDTDALDLAGRVDFAARTLLPAAPGLPPTDIEIDVEARLDRMAVGGSQVLRDVDAHLEFVEETKQWIGAEVEARLGSTPVRLSDVAWTPTETGSVFRTRLSASGLPIDEEHLDFFLDEATKRVVLDDLRARGTFALSGTALELVKDRDGTQRVSLEGALGVRDAFVDLGAPVEFTSIDAIDLRLVHEGRGLRARAFIDGAFGAIAGRSLENARLDLTYIEPRLVIEGLEGGFEGGRLAPLSRDVSDGANLFAIDLRPPFEFELAASMQDVDVGRFLRGMFNSDFANRGRMDLDMRLGGSFEELTAMQGSGEIRIMDSALWAIPVFQALSTQLGIDTTVLFREMSCAYRIERGTLIMDQMRVKSDLLSLVGRGAISFEGDVTSDLEVRYSLVDRLGPFTRLVYWIQNSLLRVSIRGSMERPTVILRGLVSQFFTLKEERDRLPLPGFSARPARF